MRRHVFLLLCLLPFAGCQPQVPPAEDDHFGAVEDFALTERSGRLVHRDDLKGKVWLAAFTFTRCAGPCTQVSGTLARLQHELKPEKDLVLVSISVDPEHDTPRVLTQYAKRYGADPDRWLFLTGEQDKVYHLIRKSFMLAVQQNEGSARTPGNEVMHDTRLWVVDRAGQLRGYYDGTQPEEVERLRKKIVVLLQEKS